MKYAIKIEGLGKQYQIGLQERLYPTLRESLAAAVAAPIRGLRRKPTSQDSFWALKDINLEVMPGEVIGVIGRNGAGKSTLLKILSRITEPTTGSAEIRGRCSSLLDVGTGFHPELTGRENIYLNGAVLGMKRCEIERKFDAIVAFAEVEKFLDTSVKYYSSGMYLRLAFAVAAHLDPEILLVDEVLSVGDAAFQKKCLGATTTVAKAGRTVLLVSHNLATIQSLCTKCLLLSDGECVQFGEVRQVVEQYLRFGNTDAAAILKNSYRTGAGSVQLMDVSVASEGRQNSSITGAPLQITLKLQNKTSAAIGNVDIGLSLHDKSEVGLGMIFSSFTGDKFEIRPGTSTVTFVMRSPLLAAGQYFLGFHLRCGGEDLDYPRSMLPFDVVEADYYEYGKLLWRDWGASVLLEGQWDAGNDSSRSAKSAD